MYEIVDFFQQGIGILRGSCLVEAPGELPERKKRGFHMFLHDYLYIILEFANVQDFSAVFCHFQRIFVEFQNRKQSFCQIVPYAHLIFWNFSFLEKFID